VRTEALSRPIHGAIWHLVAYYNMSWKSILSFICPYTDPGSCMHGTGHGFLIRHTQTSYGPLSRMQSISNVSNVARALEDCKRGPYPYDYRCTNGLYHGVMEHGDFSRDGTWAAPCDALDMSAYCFTFLFHDGLAHSWRLESMKSTQPRLRTLCEQLNTEVQVRCCIFGLASRGFTTLRRALFVAKAQRWGIRASCELQARTAFVPGHLEGRDVESELFLCELLFGRGSFQQSAGTLVDWCSMVTPLPVNANTYRRWLACISGSLGYHSFYSMPGFDSDPCKDLSAMHQANVTHMMHVCSFSTKWVETFPAFLKILE